MSYVVFLFSTTCHEAAHAWSAFRLGDDTAYRGGQVTLDPTPQQVARLREAAERAKRSLSVEVDHDVHLRDNGEARAVGAIRRASGVLDWLDGAVWVRTP